MRRFILQGVFGVWAAFSIHAGPPETNLPPKKVILFVCTGNYYRSRFAEALFNQKAARAHLSWRAISRGLNLEPWQHGISVYAQRELIKRGVPQESCKGEPKALTKVDLDKSDYVVLMNEAEHRPVLEKHFPDCDAGKIHYWHIGDTGKMTPSTACQAMTGDIGELLDTLEH